MNTQGFQIVSLVDHQRPKRIYDDSEPRLNKRSQLKTEGFPRTSRQQTDYWLQGKRSLDYFNLPFAKLPFAKNVLEQMI
jgi:hypothetical protein